MGVIKKLFNAAWAKIRGRGWKTWATAAVIGLGAFLEAMGLTEIAGWIPKILSFLGAGG